jgi:hypothetical protein
MWCALATRAWPYVPAERCAACLGCGMRHGDTADRESAERRAAPVVGRDCKLKRLYVAYGSAISDRGALAMVVGEPGIG